MAFKSVSTSESSYLATSVLREVSSSTGDDDVAHAYSELDFECKLHQYYSSEAVPFASKSRIDPACAAASASYTQNTLYEPNPTDQGSSYLPDCSPQTVIQPGYLVTSDATGSALLWDARLLLGVYANWNVQEAEFEFALATSYLGDQFWNNCCTPHEQNLDIDVAPSNDNVNYPSLSDHNHGARIPKLSPTPVAESLKCPLGCDGTFGRNSEYRRHMKKHADHPYHCTEPDCEKSFYRKDKLGDHLKQCRKLY